MTVPRIALAPGSIDGGGIGMATVNLADGLVKQGVKIDLLLTTPPKGHRPIPAGVNVVQLANRTRSALLPSVQYLRSASPDMVITSHSHMHLLLLVARQMAFRHTRSKLVWSFHTHQSTELRNAGPKKRAIETMVRWLSPRADHLVAVSDGVASDLVTQTKCGAERLTIIENPAWSSNYLELAAAACPHPWLEDYSFPIVIGAGRLVPQKDFGTLIQAFALVRSKVQARLIILGDGIERQELETLVTDLGLGDDVLLPGRVVNPFAYFSRSDVFVLSSRWEGFGMVLVEALGCGCKIVSTDCPSGPAEVLQGGRLGKLIPVSDVNQMADAILEALGQDAPIGASRQVAERYGQQAAAKAYLALLRDN